MAKLNQKLQQAKLKSLVWNKFSKRKINGFLLATMDIYDFDNIKKFAFDSKKKLLMC